MSNKNLLNEATIRRFMKLANMETLTSPFVERLDEADCPSHGGRDDAMEEGMYYGERDDAMEEDAHDGDRDDDMMDEPAMDEPAGDDVKGDVEDIVSQLVSAMEDVLDKAGMGDVMDVEDEDEMEVDMNPAPDMGEPAMDAPADDEPDEPEVMEETTEETLEEETLEEDTETALEEVTVINDEELINEVAKRVTARLVKAMAKK